MKILKLRRMGDPILRKTAKKLDREEILSDKIQNLIVDMKYTCEKMDYGVGMSASQVGEPVAISILGIKPTPNRPNLELFEKVLINAEIIETFGEPEEMWEGCCSVGGPGSDNLIYGLVLRYKKVRIKYMDEHANEHEEITEDFVAHVSQHEIDHLNGVLFTDLADPKSLMMGDEYRKRILKKED